jgi:N-acetylmuramoyl-L-alanine amidase
MERLPEPIVHTPTPSTPNPLPPPSVSPPTGQQLRGAVIVVDPGHGGDAPGTPARFPGQDGEKTINLDIGLRVASLLDERGARVTMTRNSDTSVDLSDRAATAERLRAGLFVSIHANAGPSHASGALVLIHPHASPQSQKAADSVVDALRRAGIECRTKNDEDLHVLREHSRPAILIECGFLTNRGDAQKLNSPAYRAKLATAIADGVGVYFSR